jgi:hypothetical protein
LLNVPGKCRHYNDFLSDAAFGAATRRSGAGTVGLARR